MPVDRIIDRPVFIDRPVEKIVEVEKFIDRPIEIIRDVPYPVYPEIHGVVEAGAHAVAHAGSYVDIPPPPPLFPLPEPIALVSAHTTDC